MKIKKPKISIPTPLDHVSYINEKWKKEIQSLTAMSKISISIGDNDFLSLGMSIIENGLLPEDKIEELGKFYYSATMFSARQIVIQEYGYPLLNNKFLNDFATILKNDKVLDVGAGSGFLAKQLNARGINITAIDKYQSNNNYGFTTPYFKIYEDDGVNHLKNSGIMYDTIILSWPPYDTDMAYKILEALVPGQRLIYIGEGQGGCTADEAFFKLLQQKTITIMDETDYLRENYTQYGGIHDLPASYLVRK